MTGDNGRPKMPPPGQRMIQLPGEGPLPPELRGKLPGMPPPAPSIKSIPVDTTKPTVGIQCEFYLPPGIPDVPPDGVFWETPEGGLALSPFASPPVRMLRPGEEPPEGANVLLEEDEQSEHQADVYVTEDES